MVRRYLTCAALLLLASLPLHAISAEGMLHRLETPRPSATPQTEAQKEHGRQHGRTLPTPELLQPTLDAELPAYVPKARVRGSFKGGSSDVLVDLVGRWFERFKQYQPRVNLEIVPPYAGSLGTKELIAETLDFVFVSRELKPEDLSEFNARFGYAPTSIPILGGSYRHYGFLDAMAFMVHPDNPLSQLNYQQIDSIFSSTRHRGGPAITTWGQLGLTGEWADKPINVYGIRPWNGFEEFIRQKILDHNGQRGEWREDIHFEKLVFPLARRVSEDRYALGYSGLAYFDAPVRLLALAADENSAAIPPDYENVAAARYPLGRLVYFNVNRPPGESLPPALNEFLRFVLSREGQEVVREQGIFLPLREFQAAQSRALLEP